MVATNNRSVTASRGKKRQRGLSLIEVIIAMGILVGTTAVLAQLISVGEKQASRAVEMTESQTICHNKMAELLAGLSPLTPIENEPVGLESDWSYSVAIEPIGFREVYAISVIVFQSKTKLADLAKETPSPTRSYHLTRWVNVSDLPDGVTFQTDSPTGQYEDSSNSAFGTSPTRSQGK